MFSYKLIGHTVRLHSLAEVPADVVRGSFWDIIRWGADGDISVFDAAPIRKIRKLFDAWESDSQVSVANILSILVLIDEHGAALEADLINAGLRLRHCPSRDFNWRDLWVFVSYAKPDSNLYLATRKSDAGWTRQTMLLADLVDAANWLVWSKTKAAHDGSPPPERVPRPGVKPREVRKGSKVKAVPAERIKEIYGLGKPSPQRERKLNNVFR